MKYTDPNTGKTYSSHTGLKAFAALVTILLVAVVAFDVVYAANHDLFDDTYESTTGEVEVIEKEGNTILVCKTEYDDGVTQYDWQYVSGTCETCYPPREDVIITGDCKGHTTYIDSYGFASDYHPYKVPVTATSATGATLDVDLIFTSQPAKDDLYFNAKPAAIETKSNVNIESAELIQNYRYEAEVADPESTTQIMYDALMEEKLNGSPRTDGYEYMFFLTESVQTDAGWVQCYKTAEEWGYKYYGNVLREVCDDTVYGLDDIDISSDEDYPSTRYGVDAEEANVSDGYYTLSITLSSGVYTYDFYVDTDETKTDQGKGGVIKNYSENYVWQDFGTGYEDMQVYTQLVILHEADDDPEINEEYSGWAEIESVEGDVSYSVAQSNTSTPVYLENEAIWRDAGWNMVRGWVGQSLFAKSIEDTVYDTYTSSNGVTYGFPAYMYMFYTYIVATDYAGNVEYIDSTGMYTHTDLNINKTFFCPYDSAYHSHSVTINGEQSDVREAIAYLEQLSIEACGGFDMYCKSLQNTGLNGTCIPNIYYVTLIDFPGKES